MTFVIVASSSIRTERIVKAASSLKLNERKRNFLLFFREKKSFLRNFSVFVANKKINTHFSLKIYIRMASNFWIKFKF